MDIARRNAGKNWINIIQYVTNKHIRNVLKSFRINIGANDVCDKLIAED